MSDTENTMATSTRQRTVSTKTKGDGKSGERSCKLCKDVFKDEKAELLECEYCEEYLCRKCVKLTSAEYKLMAKRTDIHWYCPPCEPKARKNLKIKKEVEERCREYYEKLEKRIVSLEGKLENKADKEEVKEMIKASEERQQSDQGASKETVDERLMDLRESENRKNNVIIHGLEEPDAENQEGRRSQDKSLMEDLCAVMETETSAVIKSFRLGKRPELSEDKTRPMKVEFKDSDTKSSFMKNLKNIGKGRFSKISVGHDMTKREREENKKKVKEAKKRNEKETSENYKHVVVGPAWDRRIIRVRKKTE